MGWLHVDSGTSVLESVNGTPSRVYPGANGGSGTNAWESNNMLKIGGASNAGSLTFNLSENTTINKVSVTGYGWKNTLVLTIGGTSCAANAFSKLANKTNVEANDPSTVEFVLSTPATSTLSFLTNSTAICITSITLFEEEIIANNDPSVSLNKNSSSLHLGGASDNITVTPSNLTNPTYLWTKVSGDDCITLSNVNASTVTLEPKGNALYATAVIRVSVDGDEINNPLTEDVNVTVSKQSSLQSPYTVAEATEIIDSNYSELLSDAYVTGIVSQIVTEYNDSFHNVSYNFSTDGEISSNQFQAFRCVGTNDYPINSTTSVMVGDTVVVKGTLAKYNDTYECSQGNTLELLTKVKYTVTFNSNGGTEIAPIQVDRYSTISAPLEPTKDGFTFDYWELSGSEYNFTSQITSNITLIAHWTENNANQEAINLIDAKTKLAFSYDHVTRDVPIYANTYSLYSGSLTEGDYIIYYGGKAMNTTVDSSRLQYASVTPNNNVITNTNTNIIWHIAQSSNYWTIYNSAENKYAASTGVANKAQMLADDTDDKALWTVTEENGTYEFVNKQNNTNGVNKNLRNNGTYGFACYGTSTGGALSLYKRDVASYQEQHSGENSNFVLGVAIDKDIQTELDSYVTDTITERGIEVRQGSTTKQFDSATLHEDNTNNLLYVTIGLGDVLANKAIANYQFTVRAYIVVGGETYYSSSVNQYKTINEMLLEYATDNNLSDELKDLAEGMFDLLAA